MLAKVFWLLAKLINGCFLSLELLPFWVYHKPKEECNCTSNVFETKSQRSPPASDSSIYFADKCPFDLKYLNGGIKTFVKTLTAGKDHWEGQNIDSVCSDESCIDVLMSQSRCRLWFVHPHEAHLECNHFGCTSRLVNVVTATDIVSICYYLKSSWIS